MKKIFIAVLCVFIVAVQAPLHNLDAQQTQQEQQAQQAQSERKSISQG